MFWQLNRKCTFVNFGFYSVSVIQILTLQHNSVISTCKLKAMFVWTKQSSSQSTPSILCNCKTCTCALLNICAQLIIIHAHFCAQMVCSSPPRKFVFIVWEVVILKSNEFYKKWPLNKECASGVFLLCTFLFNLWRCCKNSIIIVQYHHILW